MDSFGKIYERFTTFNPEIPTRKECCQCSRLYPTNWKKCPDCGSTTDQVTTHEIRHEFTCYIDEERKLHVKEEFDDCDRVIISAVEGKESIAIYLSNQDRFRLAMILLRQVDPIQEKVE